MANDLNNGYNNYQNGGIDYPNDGNVRRPMEGYDTLIRVIDRFPLRLVIVFIGLSLLLNLATFRDTLSGEGMMYATFGYIIGFVIVAAEALTGTLTRLIKDILIRIVMLAEENSAQL